MLANDEAIAEDKANEETTLNNDNYVPKFEVRLYKETKFSPYQVVYDEDITEIIAKQFSTRISAAKATNQFLKENPAALLFQKDATYKSAQTGFLSMYKYDAQEVTDYLKTNGTFEGFRGKLQQDWWYFDFDSAKGIDACGEMLVPMLTDFTVKGIPFVLFNSGFHGWHLYVPKGIVHIPDDCSKYSDNQVNKVLAEEICNSYNLIEEVVSDVDGNKTKKPIVDRGIYNFTTAFRMPFSRNEKSTRIKREYNFITLSQLMQERELKLKADPTIVFPPIVTRDHYRPVPNDLDLFTMTTEQILQPYFGTVKPILQLTEAMFASAAKTERVATARNFEHPMYEKVCIYRILNTPDLSNRAVTALRLVYYWKEKYYDEEDTLSLLRGWNRKLLRPLSEKELLHAMKSYRLTFHLCKDHICLQYCPMTDKCIYNKTRLVDDNTIKDCRMQITEYDQAQKADRSKWITFSKLYPGNPIVLKPKEILGICGANG